MQHFSQYRMFYSCVIPNLRKNKIKLYFTVLLLTWLQSLEGRETVVDYLHQILEGILLLLFNFLFHLSLFCYLTVLYVLIPRQMYRRGQHQPLSPYIYSY